ncbi:MAG TPA: protein-tyrosine-phosphatase [Flavobacteriales bacterium]|nr:protein-tyrosine-phosphatase [Flavobacteriales bacterium]
MLFPTLLLSLLTPDTPMDRTLHPDLQRYVDERVVPAMAAIPAERKESLDLIAAFVKERKAAGANADLTFICTHNSRRSHLSQLWAATAAWRFGQDHVRTYSGGTEATAFNTRAVAAVERAGFLVVKPEGKNPVYEVSFTSDSNAESCWSKKYDDAANPKKDFCAVMTCSEADKNCPIVFGALDRISLPYNDPKEADGTPEEAARYDERCLQIAAELWYVMQQAAR